MKQTLGETARLRVKDGWSDQAGQWRDIQGPRASLDRGMSQGPSSPRSRGFLELLLTWPELDWWMSSTQVGIGESGGPQAAHGGVIQDPNLALEMGTLVLTGPKCLPTPGTSPSTLRTLEGLHLPLD